MSSEGQKGFGRRLIDGADRLLKKAHEALTKDEPYIRDPKIDIEYNSIRVFFPTTGRKIQFTLIPDPSLSQDEGQKMWDAFISQSDRTSRAMGKHKIVLVSRPPEESVGFGGVIEDFDDPNIPDGKRKLSGGIIRKEYGVSIDEYLDAWYLARNTLLLRLKR